MVHSTRLESVRCKRLGGSNPPPSALRQAQCFAVKYFMPWFVYILFCDQKIYYVGSTNNVHRRLSEHQNKQSDYTHKFSDIKLLYSEKLESKEKALVRERQIKGWSVAKKKALISGKKGLLKQLNRSTEFVDV